MIAAYRKLIAALVGLAALLLQRHYGVDLAGAEPLVVEMLVALATAVGVWALPNAAEGRS